jgi:hypothetical protein
MMAAFFQKTRTRPSPRLISGALIRPDAQWWRFFVRRLRVIASTARAGWEVQGA